MRLVKIFSLVILSALCFGFSSCGSGVDCENTTAIDAEINAALDVLISASNAYTSDPSNTDKCNDFRKATEDFIELGKDYEECVPAEDLDQYKADLRDAEENLAMIEC